MDLSAPLNAESPTNLANMNERISIAAIGCGSRTQTYFNLAAAKPELFEIVAAADPDTARLNEAEQLSQNPNFVRFRDDIEILDKPRLADLIIIGTQDQDHEEQAIEAMELGYHLLLEKPIAVRPEGLRRILKASQDYGRRVMVCHVLRYTSLYQAIKHTLMSGVIGELITFHATEGLIPWHYAHAYIRGQWARRDESSPMILAKCSHDMDILRWLVGSPCISVASHGGLSQFHRKNAPAGAPARCLDGCPVQDTCYYFAEHYLSSQRRWLALAMGGSKTASDDEIRNYLQKTDWGRCVYQADNDVVDNQTLSLEFKSGVTGTFNMHGFGGGRNLELWGTKGRLYAGEELHAQTGHWILWIDLNGNKYPVDFDINEEADDGHFGGDSGLVDALYGEMTCDVEEMTTSLAVSLESHWMAFAAEKSRLEQRMVTLDEVLANG